MAGRWWGPRCGAAGGGGAQGLFDGLHQAVRPEWLVEDGLKALLACLHDRVRGVPAEAGHQDDRHVGLDFAESLEGLVAVQIRQADIDQGGRIGSLRMRAIASWASWAVSTLAPWQPSR